ncbi:hypothetical protein ACFLZH_05515 [Patescibacteria group bacterium]
MKTPRINSKEQIRERESLSFMKFFEDLMKSLTIQMDETQKSFGMQAAMKYYSFREFIKRFVCELPSSVWGIELTPAEQEFLRNLLETQFDFEQSLAPDQKSDNHLLISNEHRRIHAYINALIVSKQFEYSNHKVEDWDLAQVLDARGAYSINVSSKLFEEKGDQKNLSGEEAYRTTLNIVRNVLPSDILGMSRDLFTSIDSIGLAIDANPDGRTYKVYLTFLAEVIASILTTASAAASFNRESPNDVPQSDREIDDLVERFSREAIAAHK